MLVFQNLPSTTESPADRCGVDPHRQRQRAAREIQRRRVRDRQVVVDLVEAHGRCRTCRRRKPVRQGASRCCCCPMRRRWSCRSVSLKPHAAARPEGGARDAVVRGVRLSRARHRQGVALRAAVGPRAEGVAVAARGLVPSLDRVVEAHERVEHEGRGRARRRRRTQSARSARCRTAG